VRRPLHVNYDNPMADADDATAHGERARTIFFPREQHEKLLIGIVEP
jgi:hypothetical protein